jgi:catalase
MHRYLTTGMYASHKGNPITFRFEVMADDMTAASEVVANRVMARKTYAGKLSFDLVQSNKED